MIRDEILVTSAVFIPHQSLLCSNSSFRGYALCVLQCSFLIWEAFPLAAMEEQPRRRGRPPLLCFHCRRRKIKCELAIENKTGKGEHNLSVSGQVDSSTLLLLLLINETSVEYAFNGTTSNSHRRCRYSRQCSRTSALQTRSCSHNRWAFLDLANNRTTSRPTWSRYWSYEAFRNSTKLVEPDRHQNKAHV